MNIVCIGAHPDDVELLAGGTCVKWVEAGYRVVMVSMTNGDAGHYEMGGGPLARRRIAEAHRSAKRAGMLSRVFEFHDGELEPSLDARRRVVSAVREFQADIVLTHRPNDYHPDHRYTSMIVQDAAFMVTVPNFCPDMPALKKNPVFLFMMDTFQKPTPFQPDVAVDVTDVMDAKWSMLDAMESQVYEWLPWLSGTLETVPKDRVARRAWLESAWAPTFQAYTDQGRAALETWYGKDAAASAVFAELFEICEYGRQPEPGELAGLFPFLPRRG